MGSTAVAKGPAPDRGAPTGEGASAASRNAGMTGAGPPSTRVASRVFWVALAIRLLYLWESSDTPSFELPLVDAEVYHSVATELAETGELTRQIFYQSFLYPYLLSKLYAVVGPSVIWAKVLQATLGAVTCAGIARLGERLFDERTGRVAGLLAALYGPLVFFETELLATGLSAAWTVALLLLALRALRSRSVLLWLVLGASGALAIATRATFAPFVATLSVGLTVGHFRRDRKGLLRPTMALVASAAVILSTLAVASGRVTGSASPLPTAGALNLYLGNDASVCDTLAIRPGKRWNDLTTVPGAPSGSPAWQSHFAGLFRERVRTDPLGVVAGDLRKLLALFDSTEAPRNVDIYLHREWSVLLTLTVWKIGRFGFPFGVLLPLAALGLGVHRRRIPWPLWAFLGTYAVSLALVFISGRYRVAMLPAMLPPAAAGLVCILDRLRHGIRIPRAGASAMLAAVAVGVVPGPLCPVPDLRAEYWYLVGAASERAGATELARRQYERSLALAPDRFETLHVAGRLNSGLGRFAEALPLLRRAAEQQADDAVVRGDLGQALGKTGDLPAAIRELERATELDPRYVPAHTNLGVALAMSGDFERARHFFERALALDPDNPQASANLGRLRRLTQPSAPGP